jgi:hypothetical protein
VEKEGESRDVVIQIIFLASSKCSWETSNPTSSTGSVSFSPTDSLACNR